MRHSSKYLCLFHNHTYRLITEKDMFKHHSEIKFVLYPADKITNTYIAHPVPMRLKNMTHAVVHMSSIIQFNSWDNNEHDKELFPFGDVTKICHSIEEFFSYIHSIYRIQLINDLLYDNDVPSYIQLHFDEFRIEIYRNKKVIDACGLSVKESKKDKEFFSTKDLLDFIQHWYCPHHTTTSELLILRKNKTWCFDSDPHIHDIAGVYLTTTHSFKFCKPDYLQIFVKIISSIMFFIQIIPDPMKEMIKKKVEPSQYQDSLRCFDHWLLKPSEMIEYLSYMPYLLVTIQSVKEIVETNEYHHQYHCFATFDVNLGYSKSKGGHLNVPVSCTDRNPITIESFIDQLLERIT